MREVSSPSPCIAVKPDDGDSVIFQENAHKTYRGHVFYHPKQCILKGKSPKTNLIFVMFHSSIYMGNLMMTDLLGFLKNNGGTLNKQNAPS